MHLDLLLYYVDNEDCWLLVWELADVRVEGRNMKVRGEVG